MKIIAISDTHGKHQHLKLPKGDMIIHAGDISRTGLKSEVLDFLNWYGALDFPYKIFIAGNHDFYFEKESEKEIKNIIPKDVIYLNDSGILIEGIKIWGSPIQPWFFDFAFNRKRGEEIAKHWELIPEDTDILVTHGPAFGVLDKTVVGKEVGCTDLLEYIKKIKPKFHIAGHIHEAYGQVEIEGTNFINASVLNLNYRLVNEPVVFELDNID